MNTNIYNGPSEDPFLGIIQDLNRRNLEVAWLIVNQQWKEARAAIEEILMDCCQKLPRKHWMGGRLRSTLAHIQLTQGEAQDALTNLEAAEKLVREFPQICYTDQRVIEALLKQARGQLGCRA